MAVLQTIEIPDQAKDWYPTLPPRPLLRYVEASASVRTATATCLAGLMEPWLDLTRQVSGATLYQSYGWCAAWVEACASLGKAEDLRIITVWEDDRLVLLWPLAVRRLGSIGILHALAEPATQYCDLLVEPSSRAAEWVDLAWKELSAQRGIDIVHLHNVRTGAGLEHLPLARFRRHVLSSDTAPFLRLAACEAGDAHDGPRSRSGRSVNALKRHLRNLQKHGEVKLEVVPPCRHVAAVVEALDLKRRWLEARGAVSAGYDHPANEAAIKEMARNGHFLVMRSTVDGETAAIEIGVLDRGHYYSLIQSYDQKFAAHAPGRLLLWQFFMQGAAGIDTFDFLPPAQPHKTEWTDASTSVTDYAIPFNLKGRLALFYLRTGKGALKKAYAGLPMMVRRRIHGLSTFFY